MHKKISYRIINIGLSMGLGLLLSAGAAKAQYAPTTPTQNDLYCSGLITDQAAPDKLYVISGENAGHKSTFGGSDFIYINAGQEQGVKPGDQFEVIRPVKDMMAPTPWFKYQNALMRAMGTRYEDVGRLRVPHADAKVSTTQMNVRCDAMQRGDIVLPFVPRPAPQFHAVNLDPFAPPSGKKQAMVVTARDYDVLAGPGRIIYINLGSAQGVRIGDYYRVFRYQGTRNEELYQLKNTEYKVEGFGSAPVPYQWNDLPRQILGEGIVLRTGPNSSTVMLTTVRFEVMAGDYVELE